MNCIRVENLRKPRAEVSGYCLIWTFCSLTIASRVRSCSFEISRGRAGHLSESLPSDLQVARLRSRGGCEAPRGAESSRDSAPSHLVHRQPVSFLPDPEAAAARLAARFAVRIEQLAQDRPPIFPRQSTSAGPARGWPARSAIRSRDGTAVSAHFQPAPFIRFSQAQAINCKQTSFIPGSP